MKTALLITLTTSLCFAQYATGKIDMHGGKESYSYEKKNSFRSTSMGLGVLLDNKKPKKTGEKKVTKEKTK